jgi:orotidine-5'-phosphate decarboxylase
MNSPTASLAERLIVALDVPTKAEALELVRQLRSDIWFFKVGLQLYTATGPEIARELLAMGAKVFLDLKLHDIPNTVARAIESASDLGVQIVTVHLSGGDAMIRAALAARKSNLAIFGVTVLTSADDETLRQTGVESTADEQVLRLAELGAAAGIDGLVASPREIKILREKFGTKIRIATPGVRPKWSDSGDQKRIMTPREAFAAGADYLVIGRPITAASNPREALAKILGELQE